MGFKPNWNSFENLFGKRKKGIILHGLKAACYAQHGAWPNPAARLKPVAFGIPCRLGCSRSTPRARAPHDCELSQPERWGNDLHGSTLVLLHQDPLKMPEKGVLTSGVVGGGGNPMATRRSLVCSGRRGQRRSSLAVRDKRETWGGGLDTWSVMRSTMGRSSPSMVDGALVIWRGGQSRWSMMAIPRAKQPQSQVDCLGTRNQVMVVGVNG
jgi:hypothetical protein